MVTTSQRTLGVPSGRIFSEVRGGKRQDAGMQSLADPLLEPSGTIITDDERKAAAAKRKLLIGAGLCTGFMLIEVVGTRDSYLVGAHRLDG